MSIVSGKQTRLPCLLLFSSPLSPTLFSPLSLTPSLSLSLSACRRSLQVLKIFYYKLVTGIHSLSKPYLLNRKVKPKKRKSRIIFCLNYSSIVISIFLNMYGRILKNKIITRHEVKHSYQINN